MVAGINMANGRRLDMGYAKAVASGVYGPIVDRFRFYYAPFNYSIVPGSTPLITDITEFVKSWQFTWDADTCKRSGSLDVDFSSMPEAARYVLFSPSNVFSPSHGTYNVVKNVGQGCVFACHEILINGVWNRWPIGWFISRSVNYERNGFSSTSLRELRPHVFVVVESSLGMTPGRLDLMDLTSYFEVVQTPATYTIPVGTDYMTAIKAAITASGFWDNVAINAPSNGSFDLGRWSIGPSGRHLTPRTISFNSRTTWKSVLDSLTEGCNFFPIFTTPNGEFTTGERVAPGLRPVEDWHGSTLTMQQIQNKAYGITIGTTIGNGWSLDGDLGVKAAYTFPQSSLWNQVVAKSSFANETAQSRVTQIIDPVSYLYEGNIGQWITNEKQIENAANVGVLQDIANWWIYYADFHSVQLSVETPITMFTDRRIHPYMRARVAYDWRNGYPTFNDYVELGWTIDGTGIMTRRFGTSPKFYGLEIDNPASPS